MDFNTGSKLILRSFSSLRFCIDVSSDDIPTAARVAPSYQVNTVCFSHDLILPINFFEIFNNDRPLGSTKNQLDLNIIAIIVAGYRDAFTVGFQDFKSVMLQILEQILHAAIPIIHNSTK